MPKAQAKKFKLEKKTKEELKIYFMIARPQSIKIPNEAVLGILAYNLEDALLKAQGLIPEFNIVFHGQIATVKELLNKIYLEQNVIVPPKKKLIEIKPEPEKLSREQFKAGLMLALEEFTKGRNKKELKKIIEKL